MADSTSITRLLTEDDAEVLADLETRNREFFAPSSPLRPDEYYTEPGQQALIRLLLDERERGSVVPLAILGPNEDVVGRITMGSITRGPLQSGGIGYWVDQAHNGRGLATAAVAETLRLAFDEMCLHRVQAETLEHNAASQRVLMRNGFEQYGRAPAYLRIAGRWQDHLMFQALNPDWTER